MKYWVIVSSDDESETYWAPQEVKKPERMRVGQSLKYRISGTYEDQMQSTSWRGIESCSILRVVIYRDIECFEMDFSFRTERTRVSGYMYFDTDYKIRSLDDGYARQYHYHRGGVRL